MYTAPLTRTSTANIYHTALSVIVLCFFRSISQGFNTIPGQLTHVKSHDLGEGAGLTGSKMQSKITFTLLSMTDPDGQKSATELIFPILFANPTFVAQHITLVYAI